MMDQNICIIQRSNGTNCSSKYNNILMSRYSALTFQNRKSLDFSGIFVQHNDNELMCCGWFVRDGRNVKVLTKNFEKKKFILMN